MTAKALKEVTKLIKATKPQIPKGQSEAYIGGGQSQLDYVGLKVPQIRNVEKKGFSFSDLDDKAQLKIWDYIWKNSTDYEVMSLPLMFFSHNKRRHLVAEHWSTFKTWVNRIDNWAHSDSLSGLYATALEQDPRKIYPELEKWNKAKNPWKKRQSIVSLIYYAGAREKVVSFSKMKKLIEPLIEEDHHYIQRGVGWTLREVGSFYPNETEKLLNKHATKLSAIAFSAAVEKLDKGKKERLKTLRKAARGK